MSTSADFHSARLYETVPRSFKHATVDLESFEIADEMASWRREIAALRQEIVQETRSDTQALLEELREMKQEITRSCKLHQSELLSAIKTVRFEPDLSPIVDAISSSEVDLTPVLDAISENFTAVSHQPVDLSPVVEAISERFTAVNHQPAARVDHNELMQELRKVGDIIQSADIDFTPVLLAISSLRSELTSARVQRPGETTYISSMNAESVQPIPVQTVPSSQDPGQYTRGQQISSTAPLLSPVTVIGGRAIQSGMLQEGLVPSANMTPIAMPQSHLPPMSYQPFISKSVSTSPDDSASSLHRAHSASSVVPNTQHIRMEAGRVLPGSARMTVEGSPVLGVVQEVAGNTEAATQNLSSDMGNSGISAQVIASNTTAVAADDAVVTDEVSAAPAQMPHDGQCTHEQIPSTAPFLSQTPIQVISSLHRAHSASSVVPNTHHVEGSPVLRVMVKGMADNTEAATMYLSSDVVSSGTSAVVTDEVSAAPPQRVPARVIQRIVPNST